MFGQSFLLTPLTLNLTRRVTFCAQRCMGASLNEASKTADEIGMSAAATVATIAGVLTVDPAGAALSATYLAVESGEADVRHSAMQKVS